MQQLASVILKDRRAKPFFYRHPWVFSGAVRSVEHSPRKGDVVNVFDSDGNFVARGFYNERSQIRVRLLTWDFNEAIDDAFFSKRIRSAVNLRTALPDLMSQTNAYRVVHSESDGLPGLIVDRYADYLVVQYLSRGVDRYRKEITDALIEIIEPKGIYERSDVLSRSKEGMKQIQAHRWGEEPPEQIEIVQNDIRFLVDVRQGHKTGFYLDQRSNRQIVSSYLFGRKVLDCFCYTGAFSIAARVLGKSDTVTAIDSSESALTLAASNAELNGIDGIEWIKDDVFQRLRDLTAIGEKFGAVILDPPKFAHSKADIEGALRGYADINMLAMQLLEPGGILVSCSCSQHIGPELHMDTINAASVEAARSVKLLELRGQSPDHPVITSCPETAYLKCFICHVE